MTTNYMKILFSILALWTLTALNAQPFIKSSDEIGINHITYDPNMMSGGVSIIDFNNDGFEDIFFTGGQNPDHLFMNLGNGEFEDVTSALNLDQLVDYYTMGAVAGDLDNDGYTDLFITTHRYQRNICLRNIDGKKFEDVTLQSGFFGTKWSSTATMADTDLDGDLDIYVGNYIDFSADPFFNNITQIESNHFFENLGNWQFKSGSDHFTGEINGCTLVSCFTDLDNDMDPDLFVVNDFGFIHTPNELYINHDGGKDFQESATEYQVDVSMNGMGIAIGDIDGNGYFDYYLSNISNNILFSGGPGSEFQDISDSYNVNDGLGYSWGTFFADINNDSYDDLFVAKGTISESADPQKNRLYQYNPTSGDFVDLSEMYGLDEVNRARGASCADLNNDGLMDIIINNMRIREVNEGKALVYFNQGQSEKRYLKLKLEGVESNRSAYGAFVEIYSGTRKLIREVRGGSSYLSNNSSVVHFGLGSLQIDSLVIHWPAGLKQSFTGLQGNHFYYLKEAEDIEEYAPAFTTSSLQLDRDEIQSNKSFSIYPNPACDYINIGASKSFSGKISITLHDAFGNLVQSLESSLYGSESIRIQLPSVPNGIYFINILSSNFQQIEKLVISK